MTRMLINGLFTVGLGAMGWHMARNIRQKVDSNTILCIYDVTLPILERFVKEHESLGPIKICQSSQEVAELSDRVFTMVPEGKVSFPVHPFLYIWLMNVLACQSCIFRRGRHQQYRCLREAFH